ncbi:MAG: hypothetical protein LBV58_02055 [Acholeplasmatales bacterium]|jgi:hypothetical protein|nr:hypothetical protein [Acholeplasmatales bacterium]
MASTKKYDKYLKKGKRYTTKNPFITIFWGIVIIAVLACVLIIVIELLEL